MKAWYGSQERWLSNTLFLYMSMYVCMYICISIRTAKTDVRYVGSEYKSFGVPSFVRMNALPTVTIP